MLQRSSLMVILLIVAACVMIGLALALGYHLEAELPLLEAEPTFGGNLGFFLLININIIVVMVLVFLVGRNIVKLVLDRRRNILGAKLRSRLVCAFVGLSLVPTVLLFVVAKGMLDRVLQGWFSPQIASAVDGAVSVAKYHYDAVESQLYRNTVDISQRAAEDFPYLSSKQTLLDDNSPSSAELIQKYLQLKIEKYGLYSLQVFDNRGEEIASAFNAEVKIEFIKLPDPNDSALREALRGATIVRPEQSMEAEFLMGYAPLHPLITGASQVPLMDGSVSSEAEELKQNGIRYVLVSSYLMPADLGKALADVLDSADDYKQLKTYHRLLASSYLLTLIGVTLLIVFAAIWVGFYLARGLSIPIGMLADGTQQVAHGNLDVQLPEIGDDELSVLVHSFNLMTRDLRQIRDQLVSGRRYMETVLASLGVGVLSVNRDERITTLNPAAADMLGIDDLVSALNSRLSDSLSDLIAAKLKEQLAELYGGEEKLYCANISINLSETSRHVQLTLSKLSDIHGDVIGAVVLFDDITELVSAQRAAAWREVARRIAHEIKNPLTPIQLNADRIKRRFAQNSSQTLGEAERELINECTETIVRQVKILHNLVNEFSRFARMPRANLRLGNINDLLRETTSILRNSYPDINFMLTADNNLPTFNFDPEQITRAITNLLENAVVAIRTAISKNLAECLPEGEKGEKKLINFSGEVQISSSYDEELGMAVISVKDNGCGVVERDRAKLFEPYFSTKTGGTGLGLTIVSSIVADHNGFIRLRETAEMKGSTFVIELPIRHLSQGEK